MGEAKVSRVVGYVESFREERGLLEQDPPDLGDAEKFGVATWWEERKSRELNSMERMRKAEKN